MDIKTLVENHRTANPFVIADNLNINYLYVVKHAIDHADLIGYYSACYGGKGKLELEANKFATELMLLLYQEQYQDIPDTFDKLIAAYGVKEEMREYY